MTSMTRSGHLAWCKERATQYVRLGKLSEAVASMNSDLRKHPDFDDRTTDMLGMLGMMEISRGSRAVQDWIDGFH